MLVLFIYITRPASNEIFSPSNKIHWEVGRAKDLSAPLYMMYKTAKSLSPRAPSSRNEKYKVSALKDVGILYDVMHAF